MLEAAAWLGILAIVVAVIAYRDYVYCPHGWRRDRCAMCAMCERHAWTTLRVGGDPTEASSYEVVTFCKHCGAERGSSERRAQ